MKSSGRYLVQGVDVWLNTPPPPAKRPADERAKGRHQRRAQLQRPRRLVARGTTARTGGPLATKKKSTANEEAQDDGRQPVVYELLENEIIPLYYDRDDAMSRAGGCARSEESIRSLAPTFSTWRMVKEYTAEMYVSGCSIRFRSGGNGTARPAPLQKAALVAARD